MTFGIASALGVVAGSLAHALGSFLAWFAIIAGAALTMKIQYWRLMRED